MDHETFSFIVLFAVLAVVLVGIFVNSAQRDKTSRKTNFAVNNSIAAMIEDRAIVGKVFSTTNPQITLGTGVLKNNYAEMIIEIGFNGESAISAKAFHENLYTNRDILIKNLNQAISFHHLDTKTTPEQRVQQGSQEMKLLLPFLILGDMQGSDGTPENPKYMKDEDYIGYMFGASAVLMSSTMI